MNNGNQDMAMTVKVNSNLKEVQREAKEAIERAMNAVGLQAVGYAQESVRVDTGRLRNSLVYMTHDASTSIGGNAFGGYAFASAEDMMAHGKPMEGSVVIGTNVEYAQEIEEGSSRRKPKPYLKPAISDHVDEYKRMIEKFLKGKQ